MASQSPDSFQTVGFDNRKFSGALRCSRREGSRILGGGRLTFCAVVFYTPLVMSVYPDVEPQDRLGACLATCDTLGRILDSVSDGIITIDRRMRIISFNRAAATITGFTHEETVGRFFPEIFADGLFDAGEPLRNALEKNEYVSGLEREIVGKAGRRRLVLATINSLFDTTGRPGGVVLALRDIQQIHELREQLKGHSAFHAIIGKNHEMREIYRLIEQVADSSASVLIHGESGTGKELVARAIHQQSPRRQRPFVTVNCAVLLESLARK